MPAATRPPQRCHGLGIEQEQERREPDGRSADGQWDEAELLFFAPDLLE